MSPRQFIFALFMVVCVFFIIIRLIQKGKLDIGYSWLWLGVGLIMLGSIIKYNWLVTLSGIVGAVQHTTTLFLLAIIFLLLLCIQFSLTISRHRRHIRRLAQQIAILTAEVRPSTQSDYDFPRSDIREK
jgi:hypothetical protein